MLDADEAETTNLDVWVERKLELMRQAHAITREHIGHAAQRSKGYYDKRVNVRSFEVDDWSICTHLGVICDVHRSGA